MAKKKFSFERAYKESFAYVRESKNYIYTAVGVFFLFGLFGFFVPAPEPVTDMIRGFIEDLLEKTQGMGFSEITWFIFWNNIRSSFFGMIYGIILGIFPMITTIANGYLLGFVARASAETESIFVLWRILPHGIFELPALFISLGLGLKLGSFVLQEKKLKALKSYLKNSFKVFVFVIMPLLIVAAVIEGALISFFG